MIEKSRAIEEIKTDIRYKERKSYQIEKEIAELGLDYDRVYTPKAKELIKKEMEFLERRKDQIDFKVFQLYKELRKAEQQ